MALLCLSAARPAWCAAAPHPPVAKRGVLDLAWQAGAPSVVLDLEGEWEFYWGRLLEPGAFRAPSTPPPIAYAPVPGTWSGRRSEGEPLPPEGYATYRLRVRGVRPGDPLAIRISTPLSACALWLDGQPVPTGSIPGTDRSTETPGAGLILASWIPTADTTEIVLQVSNHVYRDGGVPVAPWFGPKRQVERREHLHWIWGVFLVGILVAMAVYHFALFGLRRHDRSPLYLGLYCLLWSIESSVAQGTDGVVQLIWPGLAWTTLYRVDLVAYYLSVPVLFGFLAALYPREMLRGVFPTWVAVGAAFSVAHLVLPLRLATVLVPYYHLLAAVGMVLCVVTLVRAAVGGRDGARILLCGFVLVLVAGVNDMLHDLGVIHTAYVLPLGLVGFTLFQSFALSQRSAHAFATVARLSRAIGAKNRELSRLDRLKDEFLATTSHELRTPLTGIIGLSEALLGGASGVLPRIAGEHLHLIAASGRRLATLVNDLLDFSRLEHRDLRLNPTPVDLRALTEAVLAISRPLVGDRPMTLHNDIGPDTPPALGDEDRLQQILHNLVGNAIKFTAEGQIRVGAQVLGPLLEVSVMDTGEGIPAGSLDAIFERFDRGDGDATRGGTGLGLTITRKLVELHGGSIGVESTVGRGSRFHFTLPVSAETAETDLPAVLTPVVFDLADPTTPVLLPPSTAPEPIPDPEARVLVVDDDPVNLRVVAGHLALEKIAAHTVADGLSALEILEAGPQPDLVLLDVMMPGINGFEVCRRLRERFSFSALPVVLLTARNRLPDLVEGFAAGANDYLVKPFSQDELLARVRAQVQVKRAFESVRENARLRQELEHRRQSEQALRVLQRRLAHLLDAVDDPVIAVNEAGEICFVNRPGQELLGMAAVEMLGVSPERIFPCPPGEGLSFAPVAAPGSRVEPGATRILKSVVLQRGDGGRLTRDVLISALSVDDETLFVLSLRKPRRRASADGVPQGLAVVEELNRNRLRLQDLENSLNGMAPRVAENSPAFFDQLRAIDRALEQLAGRVASGGDRRRVLAVELLKLAFGCWVEATGETKADLARRSGLWTVYTNRDGWERTQTLDRYLDHPTLPTRPRWRLIERTAEFVLAALEPDDPQTERLEAALEEFRACL